MLTRRFPKLRTSHDPPLAIVIGDLDLVSSLGMAGVRSVPVAKDDDPVHLSRYCTRLSAQEERASGQTPLEGLVGLAEVLAPRPVLYYQSDEALLLVSRHRQTLQRVLRCVLPPDSLVEDLVDKSRFATLARSLRLPTPRTVVLGPSSGPRAALELTFPIVLKPARRTGLQRLGYHGKARLVASPRELHRQWSRLMALEVQVIAQELIPGPESSVESYHAYVDAGGCIVAEFTGAKIRTLPALHGFSTALRITDAPDVRALGRALVERMQFRGVLKADVKRGPDGRLHLLEINPRFSLWHHLGAAAGVNLPALVYADLVGLPRPRIGTLKLDATWCHMGSDRHAAAAAGLGRVAWGRWVLTTSARAEGRWSDPVPLWRGVLLPRLRSRGRTASHRSYAGEGA